MPHGMICENDNLLIPMFAAVVEIDFLAPEGIARIPKLSREGAAKVGTLRPPILTPELGQRVVELYSSSASFDEANAMSAAVANLATSFDAGTAEQIMGASLNKQVRYSGGFHSVLEAIKNSSLFPSARFKSLLAELDLAEEHPDLLEPEKPTSASPDPFASTPAIGSTLSTSPLEVPAPARLV
jgi:hypothetical protein